MATEQVKEGGFSWKNWYANNKERLNEKKAKRYKEDKEYREAALARSRSQRKGKSPSPDHGFTFSFQEMAERLHVTVWVLREWRRKGYFPEPQRRDGQLWFKPEHLPLLQQLGLFFAAYGVRVSAKHRSELQNIIDLIVANW